jgi:omega-6 fatty acid desaturase (delta-12 desaturase)
MTAAASTTAEDLPAETAVEPPRAVREPWPKDRRDGKTLLAAAKEFQKEDRARSWFHFFETFGVFFALQAVTALAPTMMRDAGIPFWWAAALVAALVQGLVIVRVFILYHDYMHLAILRNSAFAKWVMYAYGVYVLTPPNVWRQSHNYHHAHTAKIVGSHVGSYMMVTTKMWEAMTPTQRLVYKAFRHPLTVLFAYFTVFGVGMCVQPFLRNPKKNWDSLFALVVNVTVSAALCWFFGFWTFFFAYFLPLFVATATGAYLFYAQHDFPEINVQPRESWDYSRAALESSSFMELSPLMHWFTGNIGYHHVHHLNPGIPFYRLPEAMAAIPELQSPLGRTSLSLRDIRACFAQKLWNPETGRMVGYP